MYLTLSGGRIYYELSEDINNTKKPVLMLLPGGPGGDHAVYKNHSRDLESVFCLIYYDPRCCGRSDNFDVNTATMVNYIDDINSLRVHLNLTKFSILGTSYGAMCAIGYAIKYQDTLFKMILIGGAPSSKFLFLAKKNLERYGTFEQKKICKYLWDGNFKDDQHVAEFMRVMRSIYSFSAKREMNTPSTLSFSHKVINLGFSGFLRYFNFEESIQNIMVDTLSLVGEMDWINDPSLMVEYANKTKNTELHILKNCGHFVAIDRHDEYIERITKFMLR